MPRPGPLRRQAPAVAAAALLLPLLGLLLLGLAHAATPEFPKLTGRVVDEAGVLSGDTRDRLTTLLSQQEQAGGQQLVVVTLKSLQGFTIEDFGYRLGRAWGIGQKGRDNGVLLILAPAEHKLRIEVGYGLEGQLTDALTKVIIDQVIVPDLKRGDFNAGALDGAAAILRVLGGGEAVAGGTGPPPQETAPAPEPSSSNGLAPDLVDIVFWFAFVLFIIFQVVRLRHRADPAWRKRHGMSVWVGGSSSSSSSSSSSDSDSFSGGGGSFGGGGSSGSW